MTQLARTAAAVAAVLFACQLARADVTRNLDLSVYDPTPSTAGTAFQVQSADVGESGEYVAAASATFANNALVLDSLAGTPDNVIRDRTSISIGGAYAFLDRFEAGLHVPVYLQSGDADTSSLDTTPASGTSLGDLVVHAKARFVHTHVFSLGVAASISVPTASKDQFAGSDKVSGHGLLLVTVTPSPNLVFQLNAGGVLRARAEFANIVQKSGAAFGAGATLRVLAGLHVDAQVFGEMVPGGELSAPSMMGASFGPASALWTVEALGGVRYRAKRQLSLGAAVGAGLTSGIGSPEVRGVFTIAFTPEAREPKIPVIPTEPIDPNTHDADFDRIPDAKDKCPNDPEDKDGFQDEDGCPDLDNDGDGVPDAQDKCPNDPEDKDGFQDADGCPDPDNDKDGILDAVDKCPNQPETINGVEDEDGCPDKGEAAIVSSPDRLELMEPVTFAGGAVGKGRSANVLGQLVSVLRARTDIARLRITVHVQPSKNPAKDQELSDKRADAVREWLVGHGISQDRLEVKGFGGKKPLVPANQRGAAEINDRLELIIVDRK